MFTHYDVVEFEDGKFAVRRIKFGIFTSYQSLRSDFFWKDMAAVNSFCKTSDINEAINLKNRVSQKIKRTVKEQT